MDAAHDLEALAKRVEAADGPDRELDAVIAATAGLRVVDEGHPLGRCCYDRNGISIVLPRYTASLDAAMTLVPNSFRFILDKRGYADGRSDGYRADVWCSPVVEYQKAQAWASGPALALAAASLRALSQGVNDDATR